MALSPLFYSPEVSPFSIKDFKSEFGFFQKVIESFKRHKFSPAKYEYRQLFLPCHFVGEASGYT
jgi:predicted AlkP superfamily pyrophosphatase or phosphodiesterase